MLHTIMNIVLTWFALGVAFLVAFIGMEIIALITRPEYRDVKYSKGDPKMSVSGFLAMWFIIWPLAAYGIIRAFIKNQTFTEYLADHDKMMKELQAKAKKFAEDARGIAKDSTHEWHQFAAPNTNIMLLVRDMSGRKVPTHMIYVPEDPAKHIVCIHAMPKPSDSVPFRFLDNQTGNVPDAMKLCLEDVDWASLCVPGMESRRRARWGMERSMIRGRKKELGL